MQMTPVMELTPVIEWTPLGIIFLSVSWLAVIALNIFCFTKIFKPKK